MYLFNKNDQLQEGVFIRNLFILVISLVVFFALPGLLRFGRDFEASLQKFLIVLIDAYFLGFCFWIFNKKLSSNKKLAKKVCLIALPTSFVFLLIIPNPLIYLVKLFNNDSCGAWGCWPSFTFLCIYFILYAYPLACAFLAVAMTRNGNVEKEKTIEK